MKGFSLHVRQFIKISISFLFCGGFQIHSFKFIDDN